MQGGNIKGKLCQASQADASLENARGEHAFCIQPGCYDKNIDRLNFACKSLGIKGIGPAKAKEIYLMHRDITLISAMIHITENYASAIPDNIPMWKAILAFNQEGLGISGAKKAAKAGRLLSDTMSSTEVACELVMILNIED